MLFRAARICGVAALALCCGGLSLAQATTSAAPEHCSAAAVPSNSSWSLPLAGEAEYVTGSAVDCSLAAWECFSADSPSCNLLVLDAATGAVRLNRSLGFNDTLEPMEQFRAPPQVLSATATAAYVGYDIGDASQQCAGTELRRVAWGGSDVQWSRRLCTKLTQSHGGSDGR